MNFSLQIGIVAIIATIMATTLISSQAQQQATPSKCEDEKGKNHRWIEGCKDGWYEWDVCGIKDSGTGQYYEGYEVGWKKGQEAHPDRGPTDCK